VSVVSRPGEEELHAYIDGELPQDRRDAVASYLRDHPTEAKRLAAYRRDGVAIARLFARMPIKPPPAPRSTPSPCRW
jgi:anti-sigma factor RsiW